MINISYTDHATHNHVRTKTRTPTIPGSATPTEPSATTLTPNVLTPSKTPFTAVVTIATKTYIPTVSPTATRTWTPTRLLTSTRTPSKSPTPTPSLTPSLTPTMTLAATNTETATPVATPVGVYAAGETWTFYYYAGSDRIALRVSAGTQSAVYYLFGDHLGSTTVVLKADGSVQGVEKYKAFGEKRYPESQVDLMTDHRYTGQLEIGFELYHYGGRVYDSYLNRFLSPDSIVPDLYNPLYWDRYSYVNNNPVNYNDPSGHMPCIDSDKNGNCVVDPYWRPYLHGADKDVLTERGKTAKAYYEYMKWHEGWWNGYRKGSFTIEQFLGIWILYEAAGKGKPVITYIREAIGNQLFMDPKRYGYTNGDSHSPYCTGSVCYNGAFNLIAALSVAILDSRFKPENLNKYQHPPYSDRSYNDINNPENLSAQAADLGAYVIAYEGFYRQTNYNNWWVPYQWGNPFMETNPNYFQVLNYNGDEIWSHDYSQP